jgi:CRP-like cAMP-binding protein
MKDFFSYGQPQPAPENSPPRAILADLSSEEWEKFITYAARRRYPAGALVQDIGDTTRALGFIASGQVQLQADGAGPRARPVLRGEGEVFGILGFLDGVPSRTRASVGPEGPAELLLLTPEALQQLAAWQPRIALALLRDLGAHVAGRLRQLQPPQQPQD